MPAVVLEVEEEDVERRRSRRLGHEHVGRAAVIEEDAVTHELVSGVSECGEEGVDELLFTSS